MPHVPIYASEEFQGKSRRGKYGDTVEEIDWSVGQILGTLKEYDLDTNTLVLFSSDNGPWKVYKTEGGSAGPLRGAKGTTWEGGMREPFIAWWLGTIKKSTVCTQVLTNMDLLPTLSELIEIPLPETKIDGVDKSSLFFNPKKEISQQPFYYYSKQGILEGVRDGALKLIERNDGIELYNVEVDISEEYDLSGQQPEKVERLKKMMQEFDLEMEKEKREVGILD